MEMRRFSSLLRVSRECAEHFFVISRSGVQIPTSAPQRQPLTAISTEALRAGPLRLGRRHAGAPRCFFVELELGLVMANDLGADGVAMLGTQGREPPAVLRLPLQRFPIPGAHLAS